MGLVCGIDCGSFATLSYVAWLEERSFTLDAYVPSSAKPLPEAPPGSPPPLRFALDAPQSLPRRGAPRRHADAGADTPTRRLPADRRELADWRLYRGLIAAGIEVFWSAQEQRLAAVYGLVTGDAERPWMMETYPRYVIRRLWPDLRIPSKKKRPLEYVEALWKRLRERGYHCASVARPGVDQVDAMLCALSAQATLFDAAPPAGTVGVPPVVDRRERLLREGFIVAP